MASTANGADALTREMSAALNAEKDTAGPEDDAMTPEQVMRSISKRAEQSQKSRTTRTSYELVDQASPIRRSQTHGNLGRRPRTSPSTGGSHKVVSKAATQHGMQCSCLTLLSRCVAILLALAAANPPPGCLSVPVTCRHAPPEEPEVNAPRPVVWLCWLPVTRW